MNHKSKYVLAMTVPLLVAAACGDLTVVDAWPTFVVEGTISHASGVRAASAPVRVIIWAPPLTCGDSVASTHADTTTTANGHYQVTLFSLTGSFTGCLRLRADTVHFDTALVDVQPNAHVQVDARVP